MKKLLCAVGCFVAFTASVNFCNADIILDGMNWVPVQKPVPTARSELKIW